MRLGGCHLGDALEEGEVRLAHAQVVRGADQVDVVREQSAKDRSCRTLLTLPNRALVGSTETPQRRHLEQDAEMVARWVDGYDRLQVNALSQPDSSAMIREERKELDHA